SSGNVVGEAVALGALAISPAPSATCGTPKTSTTAITNECERNFTDAFLPACNPRPSTTFRICRAEATSSAGSQTRARVVPPTVSWSRGETPRSRVSAWFDLDGNEIDVERRVELGHANASAPRLVACERGDDEHLAECVDVRGNGRSAQASAG